LPRLAAPRGFGLLSVGAGLQPVATLATGFEKLLKKVKLKESFSVLGGNCGKSDFTAHGDQCAIQKLAPKRALHRVPQTVKERRSCPRLAPLAVESDASSVKPSRKDPSCNAGGQLS
jgi:hypothetical protein